MPIPVLLLLTIFLALLLYLFFFVAKKHEGKRVPGPKGWPILGNLPQLGAKPHQSLCELSRTYGPLFGLRFGYVDVVVAASADVAEQFLRVHDVNFSNRPPNSGAEHIAYNYQDLVFAPYGPRWRMLRKLCALHLFSPKALEDLSPVRSLEVATLANTLYLRAQSDQPTVNLAQMLTTCTTNALSKAMMGRRVFVNETTDTETSKFKDMVLEIMSLAGVFNVGDFVPWLRPFDLQRVVRKMKDVHARFDSFLDKVIAEHRMVDNAHDLLSLLIRSKDDVDNDGVKLTNTDIKALLLNLFTAGTDTSSSTVEWALSEMIRHPDALKRAQRELDEVVGRDRLVSETDIRSLPYIQAIVKETFRLHPSTPLSLPRISSEACTVNGYLIPKNTTLLVNVWAISRDPGVWKEPLEFRPERFLGGGGYETVDLKGNDFELIPFGAGRRVCAGLSLGLRMVQFLTATLVHGFDWKLVDGQSAEKLDMEEAYGLPLQRAVPLMVRPVPRLDEKAYHVVV
uniref:Flavonoid 3'-hydroxylase n=1 Tax=Allium cepa TaxID=4679 RepID=Q6QHJ9_ALLCE|nr:flavonoid 3'-hydroxylase [Allium cepa]